MELHLAPELQAEVDRLLTETGCSPEQLVEDALAIYFAEAAAMRETLDSRYDDLKSGKVKAIPGDEVRARLREKSAARRSTPVS
jgi:putative addiction module component (TIGR02574 family)